MKQPQELEVSLSFSGDTNAELDALIALIEIGMEQLALERREAA